MAGMLPFESPSVLDSADSLQFPLRLHVQPRTQSRHDPQTFGHPRSSLKNKIAEERFQGRWRSLKTLRALSHRSESAVLLCESAVLAMCPAARARAARFYCSYQLSIPS